MSTIKDDYFVDDQPVELPEKYKQMSPEEREAEIKRLEAQACTEKLRILHSLPYGAYKQT